MDVLMDVLKDLEITIFTNHYICLTHIPIPVEEFFTIP